MAQFQKGYILTKKGEEIYAQVFNKETTLEITRAKLGNGTVTSVNEYYELSDLKSPRANVPAVKTETNGNTFTITFTLASITVETGFNASEIGIFAQDKTGEEFLFAVSYDDNPSYVYDKNSAANVVNEYLVNFVVSSSEDVTITLPMDAQELASIAGTHALDAQDAQRKSETAEANAENAAMRAENNATTAANSALQVKRYAREAANGQVNSDWTLTDEKDPAYILHKPTRLSDFTNDLLAVSSTAPAEMPSGGIWLETEEE